MSLVVTLTANPMLDFVGESRLHPGRTHRIPRFEAAAGGKGLNSGRVLVALGHSVRSVTFAGGETGRMLEACLRGDGQQPLLVPTRARTRIGFEWVAPAEGTSTLFEDGFEVTPEEVARLLQALEEALEGAALLILSGSVPAPVCEGLYVEALRLSERRGIPCWLDAYGPAAQRALEGTVLPALVKPNREEFEALPAFARCGEIHRTDGAASSLVVRDGVRYRVTPPPVTEVNPIGSGDTYLGALAHARLLGMPFEAQLRWAAAAGAANAMRPDVARVGPREIEPLLGDVRIERG